MALLDPVKNFAIATVSTGYDASATSIALTAGHGALFPDPATDGAFNVVWWNSTDYSNPSDDPNKEIVRVTARSTDTLTVTRAQESTSASTKNTGAKTYKMIVAPTKKLLDDLETLLGLRTTQIYTTIVDSSTSLTLAGSLKTINSYYFTGTSDGNWTLPAVSGNTHQVIEVKNKTATANKILTITRDGSDNLWNILAVQTSFVLYPGESVKFVNEGTHWVIS